MFYIFGSERTVKFFVSLTKHRHSLIYFCFVVLDSARRFRYIKQARIFFVVGCFFYIFFCFHKNFFRFVFFLESYDFDQWWLFCLFYCVCVCVCGCKDHAHQLLMIHQFRLISIGILIGKKKKFCSVLFNGIFRVDIFHTQTHTQTDACDEQ